MSVSIKFVYSSVLIFMLLMLKGSTYIDIRETDREDVVEVEVSDEISKLEIPSGDIIEIGVNRNILVPIDKGVNIFKGEAADGNIYTESITVENSIEAKEGIEETFINLEVSNIELINYRGNHLEYVISLTVNTNKNYNVYVNVINSNKYITMHVNNKLMHKGINQVFRNVSKDTVNLDIPIELDIESLNTEKELELNIEVSDF